MVGIAILRKSDEQWPPTYVPTEHQSRQETGDVAGLTALSHFTVTLLAYVGGFQREEPDQDG